MVWLSLLSDVERQSRERELRGGSVDDIDLTRVESRREGPGRDLELEHGCLAIDRVQRDPLDDGRFEHLDLAAIKREAGAHLRPTLDLGRLVDFVIEKQLLVLAHDVREVGNELHAVAGERVGIPAASALLQLRAQYDRTDLDRRLLELRHRERRLERSHLAGRVFTYDDLHREAARRQRDTRRVEDLLARERAARRPGELQR